MVGNAIKFSDGGHVLINLQVTNKQDDKVTLLFEIQDTGIGIPEGKVDSIFNEFSQVDSSTTRKFGGTGLGLTISKKTSRADGRRNRCKKRGW